MFDLISLSKRNILIFIRDKTAVFFSFLSVIILLLLYVLFLGNSYVDGFIDSGVVINKDLKLYLITSIVMGGVIVINTASLSLGVMGNIINDIENNKLNGFLVTPVKRYKIILSYYLTSVIVTVILTMFLWIMAILYVGIFSGYWYSIITVIKVFGLIVLFTFISSTLMLYLTTLMKSVSAYSSLAGILGTLIGFISGAYIPLVQLGKLPKNIASLVPFSHMTMLLKQVLLKEPYKLLKTTPSMTDDLMLIANDVYGTNQLKIFNISINIWIILVFSILMGIGFLFLSYKRLTKKMKN